MITGDYMAKKLIKIDNGALNDLSHTLTDVNRRGTAQSLNESTNYQYLTLNEILLLNQWNKKGLLRTFVCLPVDDALKGGVKITSETLDDETKKKLESIFIKDGLPHIQELGYWARLFGGGGLITLTDEDLNKPFDKKKLNQEVSFMAVDRWRLNARAGFDKDFVQVAYSNNALNLTLDAKSVNHNSRIKSSYTPVGIVNGKPVDNSRINTMMGDVAPLITRQALSGWGLSIYEKVAEDFDTYEKTMTLIHDLLKEGKVNIIKVDRLMDSLRAGQFDDVIKVFTQMTYLKKQINTMIIDGKDDYQQTQSTLTGYGEAIQSIMTRISASLRMTSSKLFGIGASGFSNGEDNIENYNSMVNSTVRPKLREPIQEVIEILCASDLGIVPPEDLSFEYHSLREIPPKEQEEMDTSLFNRFKALHEEGILSDVEYKDKLERNNLL
ncbi:hypothetical protein DRO61_12190 [Candidatus Bathyarchaeota archaeon]|nr:MAG: hypothetical protein DRO61_12190 [Candidatus Bathyarchaeota archaeon]